MTAAAIESGASLRGGTGADDASPRPTPLMDRTTRTNWRYPLSLFRITGRITSPIFPADVLGTRFVGRLFLAFLVANDALLR